MTADRPATEPRTDLEDALRELIRVSKSAGMNAASDFGYLPSTQQADEEEISEAVQSVHAAIEAEAAQGAAPLDETDEQVEARYHAMRSWSERDELEGAAPRAEGLDADDIEVILDLACGYCEGRLGILRNGHQLTPQEGGPPPEYEECTNEIHDEGRAEEVLDRLRSLARPSSDERVPESEEPR